MTTSATSRNSMVLGLPALVRGELVDPPRLRGGDLAAGVHSGAYVVPCPGDRRLVLPCPDPRALVESDLTHLAGCLHDLPFVTVLRHVAALRELLRPDGELVQEVLAAARAWWPEGFPDGPALTALLAVLPALFDPAEVAAAVDADLSYGSRRGADLLDGWVPVGTRRPDGMAIRVADAIFGPAEAGGVREAVVRAVPTRQLHITAGNSPVIPALSLLRALATKGAAVVKVPVGSWLVGTLLVRALHRLGPRNPLVEHTSLAYWRGGDRAVEDVLFEAGAFDRVVAWGSESTMASVRARARVRTVLFEPRLGMSLVGREAFDGELPGVLRRAAVDSLIDDQTACTASLVHYVEGDEKQVLDYCTGLAELLARWDAALPHRPAPGADGLWRRLRREELAGARWFVNGRWPEPSSAVVQAGHPFDLAAHPMNRCVVVRRVDDLGSALRWVDRRVSAVGVWPPARWEGLRGPLAARGVTTVAVLGETERRWLGAPHDGLRVLDQLVNWTLA